MPLKAKKKPLGRKAVKLPRVHLAGVRFGQPPFYICNHAFTGVITPPFHVKHLQM